VTAPTIEPLTLSQVKRHCRVSIDDDDDLVTEDLIPAVRDRCELVTGRQLVEATWDLRLDSFPCDGTIDVPKPPLIAVVSVTYIDTAGATQTWAANQYQVDLPSGARSARGRIAPAYGVIWPSTRVQLNAVTVRFRAGYVPTTGIGTPDRTLVPALLRQALSRDAASLYAFREDLMADPRVTQVLPVPERAQQVYRSFKSYALAR